MIRVATPRGGESRSATGLLVLVFLVLGLVGRAHPAPAETSQPDHEALLQACNQCPSCKSHLDNANRLYGENAYGAALDEYQAAYVLQPYPLILYNIARIHHKQSQLTEAVAYYQRYITTGHAERQERARQLLSEASKELEARPAPKESPRPEPPSLLVSAPAPSAGPPRKPIYKQWWLWTLVGVAAAGAAAGIGVGVYASGPDVSGVPSWTASLRP